MRLRSLLVLSALLTFGPTHAQEWTRFRGPDGTGIGRITGLKSQLTEADYAWSVKLDGLGHSSPVLWGEKLFLTIAAADGIKRPGSGMLRSRRTTCINSTPSPPRPRRSMPSASTSPGDPAPAPRRSRSIIPAGNSGNASGPSSPPITDSAPHPSSPTGCSSSTPIRSKRRKVS